VRGGGVREAGLEGQRRTASHVAAPGGCLHARWVEAALEGAETRGQWKPVAPSAAGYAPAVSTTSSSKTTALVSVASSWRYRNPLDSLPSPGRENLEALVLSRLLNFHHASVHITPSVPLIKA
jgi:hypothetical protein